MARRASFNVGWIVIRGDSVKLERNVSHSPLRISMQLYRFIECKLHI